MTGKILVTGAPGWLGTRFVEKLVEQNRDVVCLVQKGVYTKYLEKLGIEIIEGDIRTFRSLPVLKDISTIFHIAGLIHPKLFGVKELYKVNTEGTENMLRIAKASEVDKFVYISSNSPIGCNRDRDILLNEYTIPDPYMSYGKSKLLAERAVNEEHLRGLDTTILRPCWFYGIRQPLRQTKLMRMIQRGKVPLFGDGKNLRSMTYIDNLCDAMLLAEKNKISNGETYWIADKRPYTTLEIYETIADLLEVDLNIRKIPAIVSKGMRIADRVLQRFGIYQKEIHVAGEMTEDIACSIEKAKKDLGYKPKVDLREGMKRSIEWAGEQGLL